MRAKLDTYARMLCDQCKLIERLKISEIFNAKVKEWWENHKQVDAMRIAREVKQREKDHDEYLRLKNKLGL